MSLISSQIGQFCLIIKNHKIMESFYNVVISSTRLGRLENIRGDNRHCKRNYPNKSECVPVPVKSKSNSVSFCSQINNQSPFK